MKKRPTSFLSMHMWLLNALEHLRGSYWFIPSTMAIGSVLLFFVMLYVDADLLDAGNLPVWMRIGGADSARSILSTLSGSMITVAGVLFSVTVVALTMASAQYGPRLMYMYMRDRRFQVVLGIFISTYLYCILVMRTVYSEGDEGGGFVPHASVFVAVLLGVVNIGAFIFFIHNSALSIHAGYLTVTVGEELSDTINRTLPKRDGQLQPPREFSEADLPEDFESNSHSIFPQRAGYVQSVEYESLFKIAMENDLVVRVHVAPGMFAFEQEPVMSVWPRERVSADLLREFREDVVAGIRRTPTQDIEFPILQLAEIAVRALSPGINDPYTAVNCIDRLGEGLVAIAWREMLPEYRGHEGALRLVVRMSRPRGLVEAAYDQIRQSGCGYPMVLCRILDVYLMLLGQTTDAEFMEVIIEQTSTIERAAAALPEPLDRQRVLDRCRKVRSKAMSVRV